MPHEERVRLLTDAELRHRLQVYLDGGKPGFTMQVMLNEVLSRWSAPTIRN